MDSDHVSPEPESTDESAEPVAATSVEPTETDHSVPVDAPEVEPVEDVSADAPDVEAVAAEELDEPGDDAPADGPSVVDEPAAAMSDAGEDDTDGSGIDGPSVDELEGRLGEVEQAMAQIQSGQLDEAEATLASLDQRIGSTSD